MKDLFRLDGCVALVTGASRGLGYAMAEALSAYGARVILNGRDPAALESAAARLRETGGTAEVSAFDVADAAAATEAVRRIGEAHGRLDILVNNAGVGPVGDRDAVLDAGVVDRVSQRRRGRMAPGKSRAYIPRAVSASSTRSNTLNETARSTTQ